MTFLRALAELTRATLAVLAGAAVLTAAIAATGAVLASPAPEIDLGTDDIPPLDEVVSAEASVPSRVYAADGTQIAVFRPDHTYVPIEPDQIPETVRTAVLAAEDSDFYEHRGFDPTAIARAAVTNWAEGETTQGGSTITQQLAKNLVTGDEESLDRKVRELAAAIELEERYSKDELLAAYLNVAYFGDGAIGVAAAARAYFDKPLGDVTLSEAALLAGVLPAPGQWGPRTSPELAETRRNHVLDRIAADGTAPDAEVEAAREELPELASTDRVSTEHPYFVDYVRRYALTELEIPAAQLYGGGLKIHTSLDPTLQVHAINVIRSRLGGEDDPSAAVAVVEPGTGLVRAAASGDDWDSSQVNLALGRMGGGTGRQPGSSFKPFVLAAALEHGLYPETTVPAPTLYQPEGAEQPVGNYGGGGYGSMNLFDATVRSVNTSYVWLTELLGPGTVADSARRFGLHIPEHPGVSIGIGTYETSPLEMAAAYAAFARDGSYVAPSPVVRIVDAAGDVVVDHSARAGEQVIDPRVVRMMHPSLQQVVQAGTGTAANIGRPAAGKTGTTNDHRDAWFAGYTPQLSAAVWVGYADQNRPMPGVTGGSIPADLWRDIMGPAHERFPVEHLSPPPSIFELEGRPSAPDIQRLINSIAWQTMVAQPQFDE